MDRERSTATGQLTAASAEVYEDFFVPALFGQWPDRVLDAAGLEPGDEVLDVGCGTGVLARAAADRLAGRGSVTGVDPNEGMLAVARRLHDRVTWHRAPAEALPFPDGAFDRVVSQFALMFFADRAAGLREMARVTRPGGTVTVATWAEVAASPGYAAMIDLLDRVCGDLAAEALRAPFSIGAADALAELVAPIDPDVSVRVVDGEARFDSLEAWLHTDIRGWTLADLIDDEQYEALRAAAPDALSRFVGPDGTVRFAAPALLAAASPHRGAAG